MVYQVVSTKSIVSRVIRNCKLPDITYAKDIYEWIHEAVDFLTIKWRLPKTYDKISIAGHSSALPCELVSIDAVIYKNNRLRYGLSELDPKFFKVGTCSCQELMSFFTSDPTDQAYKNQQSYALLRGEDIKQLANINTFSSIDFYQVEAGYIKTSFEEGEILLFYRYKRMDREGLPLIPDVYEAKEGIFWYVAGKLLFSGHKLPDPRITYEYCDQKATSFLNNAKKRIRSLTSDEKESLEQLWVNLIPPQGYYSNFFINAEQPKVASITSR